MTRLHEWNLSGLPLTTPEPPNSGFWFETYATGVDLGEPEAQIVERRSLRALGADEVIAGFGNRSQTFVTAICGHTPEDIHDGERALSMVLGGPGVLEWLPPRSGPKTWYHVQTSTMKMAFDDLQWLKNVIHQPYAFSLRSGPEAFSEYEVEEIFAPASSSTTSVSDGSSAGSWPGLTAGTYLSQSVVTTPWLTPSGFGSRFFMGSYLDEPVGTQGSALAVLTYSPTLVTSNPFLFTEIALESEGAGMGTPRLVGSSPQTPVAIVPQTNGFTRYYFAMPVSKKVRLEVPIIGGSASRGRIHLNQLSTATAVPGSSLFVVRTQGAISVPARLQMYGATGENLLAADPSFLTHGWSPSIGSTWANAPEGTYYLYIYPSGAYSANDVFSVYLTGQPRSARTRVKWASIDDGGPRWFPIGPFYFGGKRSQRIGTVAGGIAPDDGLTYGTSLGTSMDLRRNGTTAACAVRLIREAPETKLLHVRSSNVRLYVDPATFDQPRPGVFTTTAIDTDGVLATTLLPTTDSWAWPEIGPPITALWYQNTLSGTHSMPTGFEMSVKHRPAGHTLAPVVVQQLITVGNPTNIGGSDGGGGGGG